MRNELDRLVDGSRRDNVSLSLIFLNSDTFFPHETEILPAHQFNGIRPTYFGENQLLLTKRQFSILFIIYQQIFNMPKILNSTHVSKYKLEA